MASSVVHGLYVIPFRWFTSPLVLYRGFHRGFSMGLCREPVQGGKFQKSKKRGLILSVKLQQNYNNNNNNNRHLYCAFPKHDQSA